MYVNHPSSLPGGLVQGGSLASALSVRQILADGQRASDQVAAAHQLAQLGGLGGLVGMYGVGNSTLSAALMLEQHQHQHQQLRLRLQQQQQHQHQHQHQHQQADLMQHLLMRQQQERDLVQLLHRHQQDAQQQGNSDSHGLGGQPQQGPR
jgi:hypothetical protein